MLEFLPVAAPSHIFFKTILWWVWFFFFLRVTLADQILKIEPNFSQESTKNIPKRIKSAFPRAKLSFTFNPNLRKTIEKYTKFLIEIVKLCQKNNYIPCSKIVGVWLRHVMLRLSGLVSIDDYLYLGCADEIYWSFSDMWSIIYTHLLQARVVF